LYCDPEQQQLLSINGRLRLQPPALPTPTTAVLPVQEVQIEFVGIERVDTSWVQPSYRREHPAINTDKRKVWWISLRRMTYILRPLTLHLHSDSAYAARRAELALLAVPQQAGLTASCF
jgi:hypothetical protein